MAMRLLKQNGVELQDGLVLASGADEVHGGRLGFKWLADYRPDKITAPFALNEGCGTPISAVAGVAYILGVGEKGRLQVEIDIRGVVALPGVPWQGDNALYRLAQVLQHIQAYEPERDISLSLFSHLDTFGIERKPSCENIDQIIAEIKPKNLHLAKILSFLSRMYLTPTMVRGGVKSNSVPESIRLTCDVRTLPHQDEAYVRRQLHAVLEGLPGVSFKIDYMVVPNTSPFETEFLHCMKSATSFAFGGNDIQLVPGHSGGFTDSRFTRQLGVHTYSFTCLHPDDDTALTHAHATDESDSIRSLISRTKMMAELAYEMLAIKS